MKHNKTHVGAVLWNLKLSLWIANPKMKKMGHIAAFYHILQIFCEFVFFRFYFHLVKNRLQNWYVLFFKFFEHKSLLFRILASFFLFSVGNIDTIETTPRRAKNFPWRTRGTAHVNFVANFSQSESKIGTNEFTKSLLYMIESRKKAHFFHFWNIYSYGKFVISMNSSNICFSMLP